MRIEPGPALLRVLARMLVTAVLIVFWLPPVSGGLGAWAGWTAAGLVNVSREAAAVVLGLIAFGAACAAVYRIGKSTRAGTGLTILRVIDECSNTACEFRDDPNHVCPGADGQGA